MRIVVAAVAVVLLAACGGTHVASHRRVVLGSPVWSADGKQIAWVEVEPPADGRIWVSSPDGSNAHPVTQATDALGQIAWLRSGRFLSLADFRLFVVAGNGTSNMISPSAGPSFSLDHDATRIATGDPGCSTGCNGGVLVLSFSGRVVRRLARGSQSLDPSLSPDGRHVVFARNLCDQGGRCEKPAGIWIADIATGRLRQLERNGCCPMWSPDGKDIAFVDDALRVTSPSGKPIRSLLPLRVDTFRMAAWSLDSRSIAVLSGLQQPALTIVDVAARRTRSLRGFPSGSVPDDFSWSPDSKQLLVVTGAVPQCFSLWLVDAATGSMRRVRSC